MTKNFFLPIVLLFISLSLSAQDMYKVKADKLNVRETSDPKSKIIGFIPQNENVAVLDSSNTKYFKVKVTNGEGYVSSEYLTKIAAVPAKQVPVTKPIVEQKTSKDNSNIIFLSLITAVLLIMLFLIFKFLMNNKPLMVISAIIVIAIGYFCYVGFMVKKTISGKFTSASDSQYLSFDFKSKDSVIIQDTYVDTLFTAPYVIEDNMIKTKQQENIILLMILDEHTLIGEGFTKAVYHKK
ncbi:SH3 domain-containing protein [Pedobacter sp. LMG 31464]|uniref:SH3 domain-containing protein n=1 Tax=Pedobacter planticolens TaxID=2679964 RepID=A0A923DWY7_9SPHI|nr:SH3 domain-containing protein [Pedobacter planticolens]MBB2145536.1 SH3 domain-containing protein [Pedobacter planticolens]